MRHKIKNFASTVSLTEESNHKVVIIDEADYMNGDSVQLSVCVILLKHFTIIVDLYLLVITKIKLFGIHSRCTVIDFTIKNGQKGKNEPSLLWRECLFSLNLKTLSLIKKS